ncbi:MAG TPA: hypothetical protein VK869_08895 [Rubrobacteraceae bacterium]|nr:hypothetical protein [Rubrobacteraceae bacterium]
MLVAVLLLLGGACSGGETAGTEREPTSTQETTRQETTGPETTEETSPPEATLGAGPEPPAVVLRIEGDRRTTFSGICTVGDEENVLSGRVPKRFAFDPGGRELSCRIQKRDSGDGDLKVIFTADGTTRSVQQTKSRGSVMNISYGGD